MTPPAPDLHVRSTEQPKEPAVHGWLSGLVVVLYVAELLHLGTCIYRIVSGPGTGKRWDVARGLVTR
jgi:hypothetical protein